MLEKCSVDCSVGATEPSTRRSMKLTVMETSSRMAIHQEWSEGANFGIGVISFCFTIYRRIREKVTLQLPIRRSFILHPARFSRPVRMERTKNP